MRPHRKPHCVEPAADDSGLADRDTLEWHGGENQCSRLDKERQLATPETDLRDAADRRVDDDRRR